MHIENSIELHKIRGEDRSRIKENIYIFWLIPILLFFSYLGTKNYALFHTIVELIALSIGIIMAVLAVNTYKMILDHKLIYLGIAYGFISIFYCIHAFSLPKLNLFSQLQANESIQLWMVGRYMEGITLLAITSSFYKKVGYRKAIVVYAAVSILFLLAILRTDIFPIMVLPDRVGSLYYLINRGILCTILVGSMIFLVKNKRDFHAETYKYLMISLGFSIATELSFIFYNHIFDVHNILSHIFKLSFLYSLYIAVIQVNLKRPYEHLRQRNDTLSQENGKRLQMQKQLQEEEVLLQKILNSIGEGIIVIDQNYELLHYNDLYAEMFHIPRSILRNKKVNHIYYYVSRQFKGPKTFFDGMKQALSKNEEFREEITLKDGKILKMYMTPFEVYHIKGWVFSFRDITEEKLSRKLQEEIEEREEVYSQKKREIQMKMDFYTNFSHELKTPINIISAVGHMLKMEVEDHSPKVKKYLHILNQNCNRLIRNINNSIDINKVENGYFQLDEKNCNIIEIIEDITLSVLPYTDEKNIHLVFDTAIEEKITKVDINVMERILLNLLSNAIKFTPSGGLIQVLIEDLGQELEILVIDNGIGIEESKLEDIFERFHQGNSSLEFNPRGSGVGLYLVKKLVEMQEGRIFAHSEIGSGTTFQVILPMEEVEILEDTLDPKILHMHKLGQQEVIDIEFSSLDFNEKIVR